MLGAPYLPGADADQPVLSPGSGEGGSGYDYLPPVITPPGGRQPGGGGSTGTKPPYRFLMPNLWMNPNSPPIISTPDMPPPLTTQPPLQPGTSPTPPYVPPPIETQPTGPPVPGSSATDPTMTVEVLPVAKRWWPWALAAAAAAAGAAVLATR